MSDDFLRTAGNLSPALSARFARPPIGARVYNSANLAINNTTTTGLTFNSETFDDADFHSVSSSTGSLTAPTDGTYLVGCCVAYDVSATGYRVTTIKQAGTVVARDQRAAATGADATIVVVETIVRMTAGQAITVEVWHNAGAALNILALSSYSPYAWIWRIS